jgi:peptidoglycan/xylan/chitin deacetylase (PgdA/CDA1 family)
MRIPGLKCLNQATRWMRSRFVPGALILGYHRIAETSDDPYSVCVSPQRFTEQLDVLRQLATPMRLQDLIQKMRNGNLPSRAVALTFDDGYEDQLFEAKPLLEKYQTPATFFVTTGYLDGEFWWNELENILFCPAKLPQDLSTAINGKPFHWSCNTSEQSTGVGDSRRNLLFSLYQRMLSIPPQQQQSLLSRLREWTGADSFQTKSKALSCEEVVELASGNLIEIGAHSVTHPLLNILPLAAQRLEIHESKAFLEKLIEQPISGFSYPNGAASECTRDVVREAGFDFACASYNDVTSRGCNRFYLPRFWIGNWDAQTFSRWLQWWLPRPAG